MAGEPILIIDDTPVNLKLTRILLVNEGYKVMTAASAEEALDLLRSYHPQLVLADIQLPGIDGLELTRRIKANEATRDISGVALTAFAMKGDERKAIDAGCDGYITKPIDTRSLGARIREHLDRRAGARGGTPPAAPRPTPPRAKPEFRLRKCRPCAADSSPKARNAPASCSSIWMATSTPMRRPNPCTTGSAPAVCWAIPPSAASPAKWKPCCSNGLWRTTSSAIRSPISPSPSTARAKPETRRSRKPSFRPSLENALPSSAFPPATPSACASRSRWQEHTS